jgi:hypothetical protein
MPAEYSFVSRWHVPAPAARAWDELERRLRPTPPGAERQATGWWPGVTVAMAPRRLEVGERLVVIVRSPIGYRLRTLLELAEVDVGRTLAALSDGDLSGRGRLTVEAAGPEASVIVFEWDAVTRRAWMNSTAWLLRPAFERAHARVMRRGEAGLRSVLARA